MADFDGERKDVNTRVLIDRVKADFHQAMREILEELRLLKLEVGKIDVRVERLLEHREHVVTTGKLLAILGLSALAIVGGSWEVMRTKQNEIARDNRELRVELVEKVSHAEAKLDEAQKELWKHRREDDAENKSSKGRK